MNRICLSQTNKILAGVCGGIAQFFHFEPSIFRILFVVFVILLGKYAIMIYFLLWAILPKE